MYRKAKDYVRNLFKFIGVKLAAIKKAGRYANGSTEVVDKKANASLHMSEAFIERLRDKIRNNTFPTEGEIMSLIFDISSGENRDAVEKQVVEDIRDLINSNLDLKMAATLKAKYNQMIEDIQAAKAMAKTIEERKADESLEKARIISERIESLNDYMLKFCTVNLFDQQKREQYFDMVLRCIESYRFEDWETITEADIMLIDFLRIDDELERALTTVRAELRIMACI